MAESSLPNGDAAVASTGMWRYLSWMPTDTALTLGEAMTPLVEVDWPGVPLTLKLEGALPTGSFKDRGSAVMVQWLAAHDVPHVVVDSSGNAGASLAAYCAKAGVPCHVFSPSAAAKAKLAQIASYGAILHPVEGNRDHVTATAVAWAEDGMYASHCWNPLFLAGTETFAFEVWEQYGQDVPDAVVIPVGAGTLLLGAASGFARLHRAGLIPRVPRIYGVQSRSCEPLTLAWERGSRQPATITLKPTIAEGICTSRPPRGAQILEAVESSGGAIVSVDDQALLAAHKQLAANGVYAEYTSAAAVAGVAALSSRDLITRTDRVLVPISATGLKTASTQVPA